MTVAEREIPDAVLDALADYMLSNIPPEADMIALALGSLALDFLAETGKLAEFAAWSARQENPYPMDISQRKLEMASMALTMRGKQVAEQYEAGPGHDGKPAA